MGRYSLNGPPGNRTFAAGNPADLDTTPVVTNPKNNGAAEKNAKRPPEGVGYDSKGESAALGISFPDWQDLLCAIGSKTTATHDSNRSDLLPRIKGLFRLLDLHSEVGSCGLVDKIIISQESLGRFINTVLPGAYTNITKIDFARLDREASLRLVGIYGSKSEIVRFLFSLGSIDVKVAALLLVEDDVSVKMRPSLRSGIYILSPAPQVGSSPDLRYVIYWPEETTWNDNATGSVRKNRVTFMRYLTSLTDQIRTLISSEHEAELVFQDVDQDDDSDSEGSEMSWNDSEDASVNDRLFKFEVAKTNEQEEAVNVKAGFTVSHPAYCPSTAKIPTSRGSTREITLIPQFIVGETVQAVATTRFVPGADHTHRLDEAFSVYRFDAELKKYGSVIISPSVDATGFGLLLDKGNLKARDHAAYETYCSTVNRAEQSLLPRHIEQVKHEATSTLRKAIEAKLFGEGKQPVLTIHDVKPQSAHRQWGNEFVLQASYSWRSEPSLETSVWALDLSEDDIQKLKENPSHVPTPRMPRSATKFSLPLEWRIRRLQILGQRKALLIVDCPDKIRIWLFSLHTGFSTDRPTCNIPNVPGRQYVVAVDQHTRLVALAMTEPSGNVTLQEYLMDETSSTMYSRGSPLSLNTWYTDGTPEFAHASFFNGTEELCLVEVTGTVRVLLIPSRSFRPASIHLHSKLLYVRSSPDGTALVIVEGSPTGTKSIRVFHRASFGSNENGIVMELTESFNPTSNFCITSTGDRQKVFIMGFDVQKQRIISAALAISCKETEYQFRATDETSYTTRETTTIHNSLINCFTEVWERFPVAAAIQRQALSEDGRESTSVTFVSSLSSHPFKSYFKRMVQDFEKLSCKPTEQRLNRILVTSSPFNEIFSRTSASRYKAGEWIAELLCLIPIHIAVTSENRFVPLKDGVLDPTLERELLGAEVSKIIDSISLGWFESIFSSYMASKTVKVVSSMGEQSVGKSYSLNHMVDWSFAGSAVRSTEGVWLSVCPTKDYLVVALDFEGVHSTERTPQEDMLLVLFNTALSNLVIFRNNFALSRDVANMFTSFQASTHLFDPSANPRLFKGLLTIVIKDVVDSDKKDIVREFFAKFSQIVSKEQATNFITVLHNSQLTVIPWSVIKSKEFYALFSKLRNLLFSQKSTHGTAGEFLITLKTLMAKMKAQDWGSLDQTVIKHRVAALSEMLPAALEYGRSGSSFDADELRNLDNQGTIDHMDYNATFYVGKDEAARERNLTSLLSAWGVDPARGSVDEVAMHLNGLARSRIAHVKEWIEKNLSRFPQDNADIRNLKREFEGLADLLRNAVRLCPAQCARCQLRCILNQAHQYQAHDCRTSHLCATPCYYAEEHDELVPCQLPAGHNGKHVCNPVFHLCGEACHLAGRKGCQNHCAKPSDHEEAEHACSAKVHQCGEPCDLRNIMTSNGQRISCPSLCAVPHDEPHERHACDNRMACLLKCELCQAYCAAGDHFHGLDDSLPHLCGQEHRCRRQCGAAGICEINTTPLSVETTLTGKHSKFSYTKYTQRAKRLDCAITIPPGILAHDGQHICKTGADPFHYCEESCPNCGHICTLPLGHWQPEHDTAHGSMKLTAWAVEGTPDAVVDFQGGKFAAQGNALQLCSLICRNLGRHAHIDYCRNSKGQCQEPESEHIDVPMLPNRNRAKDWVSHKVFWARTGFKDPYSNDEQADFGKCDVQCAGPEHQATATAPARPSFCILPIFHPPHPTNWRTPGNSTYVSGDGHSFDCPNPNNLRQAFHVIFVLDKSGSMTYTDRLPLQGQPVTARITSSNNNRFGAVLSAVYGFWITRGSGATGPRRDAYSVITFESYAKTQISNDSTSTSDQLLDRLVQLSPDGGTNFDTALKETRTAMVNNWSTDRSPVVVFLSDGECWVNDNTIYDLCNEAVSRGKPLSFHAVSFGQDSSSTSLRRMVTVAERVAQDAPRDPLAPVVPCSYSDAMDTIRLAETFINIADSLKKPRAALLCR